ncbi:unnamed protein product [marine sediment metagenome]|uniref:Uncharacterized protein n=1 Tax=marine sediment metagenome TaxID=412755 RepID=X1K7Z4_9ZZZZ
METILSTYLSAARTVLVLGKCRGIAYAIANKRHGSLIKTGYHHFGILARLGFGAIRP